MISVRTLTKSYRNSVSRSVVLRRIDLDDPVQAETTAEQAVDG
jgi:hypothetical protein